MANIVINHVTYSAVPYITVPQSGGGNAKFYDTSGADLTASVLLAGSTGYGPNGEVQGQLTVPTISQDGTTHVLTLS